MPSRSGYDKDGFKYGASMSQKLAFDDPIYIQLAGSDPEISETIGCIEVLIEQKVIKRTKRVTLLLALLNVRRKAKWATSPHTNEITKMGLQSPKRDVRVIDE